MAIITLEDISLKDYGLTERAAYLKKAYFRALPEICIERPRLITRYSLDKGLLNQMRISILDKAKTYRHVLEKRTPIIRFHKAYEKGMEPFELEDSSLFAGSTTSKFKGVPLYPEFLALAIWPELWSISKRESNPYYISDEEVKALNHEIFPHWMENNITELARTRCFEENLKKYGDKKYAPELKLLERIVFFITTKLNCISHTIPDFTRVIDLGLREIINDAKHREDSTPDESKREFYAAISEAMEGIIAYSRNLAAEAEKLANKENDPVRKKELLDIAEVNRQVPEFPARTFREGLTAVWICWVAAHLENPNIGLSLGRLDQVLYDLYRKDIENKTIDISDAIELLCCLWLKIGDHVPNVPEAGEQLFGGSGSNQAITIGGVDKDGKNAVNDLTYVMLRATELMRLRDPNLNARYYSGENPEEYLKRVCEVNITTGATPALHNDKAVIKTLVGRGETIEEARDYGVIGCVEPGSNGRFYGHTGAILLNLTSALELALFNGRHRHTGMDLLISKETGGPDSFKTFDEFKAAFEGQARWLVEQSTTLNNIIGRVHQDFYPTPVLSALFEGPMEKGKDLIQGGAVINSSGAAIIGLADVADSLSAIQKVVFDDGVVTFSELLDAIKKDFKGYEELHMRLLRKTPKYGNENQFADKNVSYIMKMLDETFGEKQNYRGGRYRVGYWTMTNHAGFGRLMGAFPNGRKAHENFTSGITPVSGVTPELTPALNSISNLPVECSSNGMALNLKYTPENGDKKQMLDNFVASVEGYFDDFGGQRTGGMEIQFNITTHDKFVDAVKHPENYPELLVRVSGYTAYFKDLNPQMQKEIIDRTEYLLSTGKAVPFEPFPLPEREGTHGF
jgi:formate C-acetyltransferase